MTLRGQDGLIGADKSEEVYEGWPSQLYAEATRTKSNCRNSIDVSCVMRENRGKCMAYLVERYLDDD